jgi:Cellulase (glycosyl hydrolase family 5)
MAYKNFLIFAAKRVVLSCCLFACIATAAQPDISIPNERLTNPDVAVYRRSPQELWVYDTRPEAGVGAHGLDDNAIQLMHAANLRLVRYTMYWYQIENTIVAGKYDEKALAKWDDLVARCDRSGIVLLVVVHGNAPGVHFTQRQEGYQRFAQFMAAMAKRYPTIKFWELWNEMDQAFTDLFGAQKASIPLRERGKMYAEMLKLAYPAIKQANPKAWVLTGGMTDWNEFPRGIYEGGGAPYFDFMNLHTYGVPVLYGFVGRGLSIYSVMKEFKDEGRPLWNTEFGIDAGNVVNAWGMPHLRKQPSDDGPEFDTIHLSTWRDCLEDNARRRLYVKALGYQWIAGNETAQEKMKTQALLPPGRTPNDYGFGLLRADGRTPRPAYTWLKEGNPNKAIAAQPRRTMDIEAYIPDGFTPVGYKFDYKWRKPWMIIKGVTVDTLEPTVIRLELQRAK